MWTSGTILPETAMVWGSPATLTWGKFNLEIVKYYRGCLFVLYYRRAMHFVRVIKCGEREVNHTCPEGTMHVCMRDSVSIIFLLFMKSAYSLYKFCVPKNRGLQLITLSSLQEVYDLYEMFHTRYSLHKRACQHKVVKGVELM